MTIEETIKKAIEGGWKKTPKHCRYDGVNHNAVCIEIVLLDPDFWQSLGKAMGWGKLCDPYCRTPECSDCDELGWREQWHKFIDHLADGKSIESFFETLD